MNHDPLTQFFYLLMRDEVTTGTVERIMKDVRHSAGMDVTHSALHLEAYAKCLADEIRAIEVCSKEMRKQHNIEGAEIKKVSMSEVPTTGDRHG